MVQWFTLWEETNGSMVHPMGGNYWFNGSMAHPMGGNYWFNGSMVYLPMFRNTF